MRALILPGRAYRTDLPLLHFVARGLIEHGWQVQPVAWDAALVPGLGATAADAWVRARVVAAVRDSPIDLVVGKSLGTRAASYAAEQGWAAIWLTPLLTEPSCVAGIRDNPARQLVVGGLADPFWDTDVAAGLQARGCEVLQVPGADHLMATAGTVRTVEIQLEVARATDRFLRAPTG